MRGVWNVPYITACYLVNATIIRKEETRPSYIRNLLDADMAFCNNMRDKDIFMYVSNREDFGHLINADNFDTSHLHNELYQIFDNRWDFERRYIHENYSENFNPNNTIQQPCPDVYWFPVATPRYCKELIEEMENFGKWSDGSNSDERLDGGYENVPTRDIHMKQVGMEQHWLEFLRVIVRPLQELVFTGYYHDDPRIEGGYEQVPTRDIHMNQIGMDKHWDHFLMEIVRPLQQRVFIGYTQPPRALMNFVVRYKPDEQPSLRPHHDSSTYTINIALNRPKIDYEVR
ncbi:hypothetical protein J437_LFUL011773 [Ladona fulva]|uniref:Prolyl 4-hydroxylase alpha subunit domain-containing protein n=1 Tax=Ladona fulva TaxID=123851 RepID=A0A8K0KGF8_LADFU|nr:hypothetical protein J437_LFUL011773 [Ladona fulva]